MKQNKILNKVYKHKIDINHAYNRLYLKYPRSYFIKFKFKVRHHFWLNLLLKILTILPTPTFIVRFILKKADLNEMDMLTKNDLLLLVSTKKVFVEVMADNVYISIKTL